MWHQNQVREKSEGGGWSQGSAMTSKEEAAWHLNQVEGVGVESRICHDRQGRGSMTSEPSRGGGDSVKDLPWQASRWQPLSPHKKKNIWEPPLHSVICPTSLLEISTAEKFHLLFVCNLMSYYTGNSTTSFLFIFHALLFPHSWYECTIITRLNKVFF